MTPSNTFKSCWECEKTNTPLHNHHPVPKVRGGERTIPLCEECHSKAHHRKKNMNTSALTREGLRRAKARGVKMGNPRWRESIEAARSTAYKHADDFALQMSPIIDELRAAGVHSFAATARALNARGIQTRLGKKWFPSTISNVINRLKAIN